MRACTRRLLCCTPTKLSSPGAEGPESSGESSDITQPSGIVEGRVRDMEAGEHRDRKHHAPGPAGSANTASSLMSLPEALHSEVLSRLDTPQDLGHAIRVCRLWHTLALPSVHRLCVSHRALRSCHELCAKLPALEELELECEPGGSITVNRIALAVSQHCPNLRSFRACSAGPSFAFLKDLELTNLLLRCPHLHTLCVGAPDHAHFNGAGLYPSASARGWRTCSDPVPAEDGQHLPAGSTQPEAAGAWIVTEGGRVEVRLPLLLAVRVERERELEILETSTKSSIQALNLWSRSSRRLFSEPLSPRERTWGSPFLSWQRTRRLMASYLRMTCRLLEVAAHCPNLRAFRLQPVVLDLPRSEQVLFLQKLAALGHLRHLQALELIGESGLSLEFHTPMCQLPTDFANLLQLKVLLLQNMHGLGEIEVVCHLPALESLVLDNCGITGLPSSIGLLPKLQVLRVRSCNCGNSFHVPESMGCLLALKKLELSELFGVTHLPVTVGYLPMLEDLDLSGCEYLEVLPDGLFKMTTLKRVNLKECVKLPPKDYALSFMAGVEVCHSF